MSFVWDSAKRLSNLAKHDVDFTSVELFEFDRALVRASLQSGEPRLEAYAPLAGRLHVLIYSIETATIRVISLRKANKREFRQWTRET